MKIASSRKPELGVYAVTERGHAQVDGFGAGAGEQVPDEQRGERGAAELCDPVEARERRLDPPGNEEAERDRRVEVPARDVPERAHHHADRQPIGDGHSDQGRVVGTGGGRRRSGSDEGERERADHLGYPTAKGVFGHGGNLRFRSDGPGGHRLRRVRRRVTFSRNLTLSLSRTCRCYCKYCAFATHRAHLYSPEEVIEILDGAARRQVKELLVLTGEKPEINPEVAARLAEHGHEDFTAYVVWACERALERGLLPHTNLGVLSHGDLARLREVTASQGLMLESVSERLMETVHAGSPTKHPARRLETIRAAGELKIPFTSGILVGIGETEEERIASLEAIAAVHAEHGHIQEVILQNFVPHQRYYGQEPAEIADAAARAYWRTGVAADGEVRRFSGRTCRCPSGRARSRSTT